MGRNIFALNQISKSFPGVQALRDISFSLEEGEVLALLGENGAGKSTLVKCLTGAYTPDSGTMEIFGVSYSRIIPKEARDIGIGVVYQEFNLIPDLPVVENVFIGNLPGNGFFVDYQSMLAKARQFFDSFEVDIDPRMMLGSLSPAMMQIVEIAKAMMLDPKVLILDEPTAPLTIKETEILFRIIRRIKSKGVSVLYISHRLEEVFRICDRFVVLRDGMKVGEGQTTGSTRKDLIKLMIGRELTNYYPEHTTQATREVILKAVNLSGNGVRNISFSLHKGEILGFAGLVGAGRTELMSLLFNDVKPSSGTVIIKEKPYTGNQPWHAIKAGVALLPEDRKRRGLILDKSVGMNLTLASIKKMSKLGMINFKKENDCIKHYCDLFNVKTPGYKQEVQYLSGGNQQKLIVAKWLSTNSDILIFDEPTRGIDVGTKHEIYNVIHKLADDGCSILMVSSEFEELVGIADRIAVMSEGELVGFVNKKDFNKEKLLDMASGKR